MLLRRKLIPIYIEVVMPPNSITRLRYNNDENLTIPITFKNNDSSSKIIKQSVAVSKPTIFDFKIVIGSDKSIVHYILGQKNETIRLVLGADYDIKYQSVDDNFIDDLINIDFKSRSFDDSKVLNEKNKLIIDSLILSHKIKEEDRVPLLLFSELNFLLNVDEINNKDLMISHSTAFEENVNDIYHNLSTIVSALRTTYLIAQ